MKNTALFFTIISLCTSCLFSSKDNTPTPSNPVPPTGEKSEIPDSLAGKWLWGHFSMTDYWKYDGTYLGNEFETSVAFNFIPGGEFEMYFAASSTYYYCTTQSFTYKKGTVKFNDDHSFIIYPSSGRFRGYYTCTPTKNFDRPATTSEIPADTLYWSFENDDYGKKHLVIRNNKDDYPSYFDRTSW